MMATAYPTEEAAGVAVLDASPSVGALDREQDAVDRLVASIIVTGLRDADRVDHLASGWGA